MQLPAQPSELDVWQNFSHTQLKNSRARYSSVALRLLLRVMILLVAAELVDSPFALLALVVDRR
jgi:hypothetical protein